MKTVAELASAILQSRDAAELQRLAGNWRYPKGELPDFRGKAFLTKEELLQVSAWKREERWTATRHRLAKNSPREVEIVTRSAFALAVESASAMTTVAVLRALQGVDVAVASAVLASVMPDRFGIIDRKVWRVLHSLTKDKRFDLGSRTPFSPKQYQLYVDILGELRSLTNLSARSLDKAFWVESDPVRKLRGILKGHSTAEQLAALAREDAEAEARREALLDSQVRRPA
ncbi:MAG: hypothetical protein GEU75_11465 [Dehalococcoidia bacterium]|nr:hypothetical protein [Dehalococcoidia bacterium]